MSGERYLRVVLPGLAVHDRRRRITQAHDGLLQAVAAARAAGIPWKDFGHAAGISPQTAQKRWSARVGTQASSDSGATLRPGQ